MMPAHGQQKAWPALSCLLYHEIGMHAQPHSNLDCFCLAGRFREQMAFLRDNGIRVMGATEACDAVASGQLAGGPVVVLSFDDGDTSFLEHALPVLQEFGFPSIVFAVAGLLGLQSRWVKDPRNARPLMSGSQLRSLAAYQVEIGSHSMTHRKLPDLPASDIARELHDSKARLEDLLGTAVPSFAYPHGRYDAVTMELAGAQGYRYGFTTDAHRTFTGAWGLQVPRKYVTCHDGLESFASKIGAVALPRQ